MLSGETGRKNRQTNKETDRQTGKESKAQAQRYVYLAMFWACRVVCLCALCLSVTDIRDHSQATKRALTLYYTYNIANM